MGISTRTVIWATVVLVASATGPAAFAGPSSTIASAVAGPAGTTDAEIVEWANELAPVALGQGALDALAATDWVGALALAVTQAGAAPPALAQAPTVALPAMGLAPEVEAAISDLVNAVIGSQTLVGASGVANAQAALLVAEAIERALAVLDQPGAPSEDGGAATLPFDVDAFTHELEHLNGARSEGRPVFADMEKMKAWDEALREYAPGTGPSIEEHTALHNNAVQAPLLHALEHGAARIQAFVDEVRTYAEQNAGADALGGTCGVTGTTITLPGCVVIIATDPTESNVYTAPADDAVLIVDLGGSDTYLGQFAGAGAGEMRVAVDVGIDRDLYIASGPSALGAQGAGMGGVGVLVNAGGNDAYLAVGSGGAYGQGYASGVGVGALVDIAGDDLYNLLDVAVVINPGPPPFGAAAADVTTVSRSTEVRGQGAASGGGIGALLDVTGGDTYNAFAHSAAIQPIFQYGGVLSPGQTVLRKAISGAVSVTAQGAASGGSHQAPIGVVGLPGVGLQVDAGLVAGADTYNALAVSLASAWVHSQAPPGFCTFTPPPFSCLPPPPVSRFCDGNSGAADVRAQGAAHGDLGIAASASSGGFSIRYVDAASLAVGECDEVGSGVYNAPMVSSGTSGAATALGQGYGTGTGAGALVNAGSSFDRLLSDSAAVGISECSGGTSPGTCGATATVGGAYTAGQGAGEGSRGIGVSVSTGALGANDHAAGAYESANAWAFGRGPGEIAFHETTYLGAALPTARVQGASSGGGTGALVDVGGTDAYNTQVPWAFAVVPPALRPPIPPLGVERVTQGFGGVGGGTVITPGVDLDKGERDGSTGIALLADLGGTPGDIYLENGFPASGALNDATWGTTPSAASLGPPPTLEIGIDR